MHACSYRPTSITQSWPFATTMVSKARSKDTILVKAIKQRDLVHGRTLRKNSNSTLSEIQIRRYPKIQIRRYPKIQIRRYPKILIRRYPKIQIRHSSTLFIEYSLHMSNHVQRAC